MDPEPGVTNAIIPAGAALSAEVDLRNGRLHRIDMPEAWTAASITLLGRSSEGPFRALYLETAEYVVTTAAAGRSIVINPALAFGIRHLKVRSGVEGAPVNQLAERTLKLVTVSE